VQAETLLFKELGASVSTAKTFTEAQYAVMRNNGPVRFTEGDAATISATFVRRLRPDLCEEYQNPEAPLALSFGESGGDFDTEVLRKLQEDGLDDTPQNRSKIAKKRAANRKDLIPAYGRLAG
jgi:hypothetical protein